MSHKQEYEDNITLYSLGLLSGAELEELKRHIESGCATCEKLLEESNIVFSALPYGLEDVPVPDSLEDSIFDKIELREEVPQTSPKAGFWQSVRPFWLNLGTAASFALIVFLIISNLMLMNKLSSQRADMDELIAKSGKESHVMHFMMAPKLDSVELASQMSGMDATGKLLMNPETHQALLLVSNAPTLEKGKTYQLWIVDEGKPVSMGTFDVDSKGNTMMEIKSMPEPTKNSQFAITLEPEGGMPHPTGAMYLAGSL